MMLVSRPARIEPRFRKVPLLSLFSITAVIVCFGELYDLHGTPEELNEAYEVLACRKLVSK
jgi:hypothetical protein